MRGLRIFWLIIEDAFWSGVVIVLLVVGLLILAIVDQLERWQENRPRT